MNVIRGASSRWATLPGKTAVTIGVLDGVHRGHRALLQALDPTLITTVLTFDPHPVEVLRPGTKPRLITTVDERISILDMVGISQVGILDLREIKDLRPEDFVVDVLVERLEAAQIVVGPDFRFGRDRGGDVPLLQRLGPKFHFAVEVVEFVIDEGSPVSSSRIREMIEAGDVARANEALGSRFTLTGEVVDGDKRGREIGFPTANLIPPPRKVVPGIGVYAAYVTTSHGLSHAAVNVGVRPTFGGGELLIEAYLLDFNHGLYGEEITVEFVEYLRPELKFDDVADLVDRMGEDVEKSRVILTATTSNMS